jgi:quercetin dioxygenase-like cupin family protein
MGPLIQPRRLGCPARSRRRWLMPEDSAMRTLNIHLAGLVAGLLALPSVLSAQDAATPRPLRWAVAPPLLPPGAMIAVVSGDPTGKGQSTIQLSMPDGYRMPPHFHPTDERVEVKQGTLLVGMGDRLDVGKTMALTTGDTILAPAGFHHYSIAKGTTVVSVRFIGPYTITYVHTYEAPRQASFPYGY